MKVYPDTIIVSPSRDGNGFVGGLTYIAMRISDDTTSPLYTITLGLHEKVISYPCGEERSPHLWDGVDDKAMGFFVLVSC